MKQGVRVIESSNQRYEWQVQWRELSHSGKSVRHAKFFHSRKEADHFAAEKKREINAHGATASAPNRDEKAALVMFREWKRHHPTAPSMTEIVEEAHRRFEIIGDGHTVEMAITRRLETMDQDGSPRSRDDVRVRLSRFARDFGSRLVASIESREIKQWLDDQEVGKQTFTNYLRVVGSMFKTAIKEGWLEKDPTQSIRKPVIRKDKPKPLQPEVMKALLDAADASIVPSLVLQAFCGIRVAETQRLKWADIRLTGDDLHIDLAERITKTSRTRVVPIPPNAVKWLLRHQRPAEESVAPGNSPYRVKREAALKACKLGEMETNILRHSFGSYRMATTGNAALTSAEMGNSPNVVMRFYNKAVSKEQAKGWWEVEPDEGTGGVPPAD